MSRKFFCAHGHFYQPPRENPWLESIETQDSAAPFHDWNERINRECYAPNTVSRALDAGGRIRKIVNNFKRISFNIGPTLFSWLQENDPLTYDRIIVADKISAEKRGGHGNAIAQCYNHMIMPLATGRDRVTQIRWGIADFIHRFGRAPEGMWLPETAVCHETLKALVDHGIKFTILAQSQARAVKEPGADHFAPLTRGIDPTRPYRINLPGDEKLALFFYDGPISRAVAFEKLLATGDKFADRIVTGFNHVRPWPQFLTIATDGETFGHHHRFGEMALTFALDRLRKRDDIELTNYGQFLENHPPEAEVAIVENSAWSCAHGVGRWREDCGCAIDPDRGWSQAWRKPLRESLDRLKEGLDRIFEEEGGHILRDPWGARDRYIEVILDRTKAPSFLEAELAAGVDGANRIKAMELLELQRNSMLMFTSCGWFFDDIAGIETVQIMKYAARAIQLAEPWGGAALEEEFTAGLAAAKSNQPRYGDGARIYETQVTPERTTLRRVAASHAIATTLGEKIDGVGAGFEVREEERAREAHGDNSLTMVRSRVVSRMTTEEREYLVATLALGASDVTCYVRRLENGDFPDMVHHLMDAWRSQPLAKLLRIIDELFENEGTPFQIRDLFTDTRRRVVAGVAASHVDRFAETYEKLFWENSRLMDYVIDTGVPLPAEFDMAATYIMKRELEKAARELDTIDGLDRLADRMGQVERWRLAVDLGRVRNIMERALQEMIDQMVRRRDRKGVDEVIRILLAAASAGIELDLWEMQNRFADTYFARRDNPADPFYSSSEVRKLGILLNFSFANQVA